MSVLFIKAVKAVTLCIMPSLFSIGLLPLSYVFVSRSPLILSSLDCCARASSSLFRLPPLHIRFPPFRFFDSRSNRHEAIVLAACQDSFAIGFAAASWLPDHPSCMTIPGGSKDAIQLRCLATVQWIPSTCSNEPDGTAPSRTWFRDEGEEEEMSSRKHDKFE